MGLLQAAACVQQTLGGGGQVRKGREVGMGVVRGHSEVLCLWGHGGVRGRASKRSYGGVDWQVGGSTLLTGDSCACWAELRLAECEAQSRDQTC